MTQAVVLTQGIVGAEPLDEFAGHRRVAVRHIDMIEGTTFHAVACETNAAVPHCEDKRVVLVAALRDGGGECSSGGGTALYVPNLAHPSPTMATQCRSKSPTRVEERRDGRERKCGRCGVRSSTQQHRDRALVTKVFVCFRIY